VLYSRTRKPREGPSRDKSLDGQPGYITKGLLIMAKQERKDYNTAAMLGIPITDQEVCEDLNINMALANTPDINKAALNAVFNRNVKEMVEQGMNRQEAIEEATKERRNAEKLNANLRKMSGI